MTESENNRENGNLTPDIELFEMRLELVPLPVADVDRAKTFYVEKVGFKLDHDVQPNPGMRVVQLTPPGSGCSLLIGTGMGDITAMTPGSLKGLHLVVKNIATARRVLLGRGLEISNIDEFPGGIKFAYFSDPDGNSWNLQEIPAGIVPPEF